MKQVQLKFFRERPNHNEHSMSYFYDVYVDGEKIEDKRLEHEESIDRGRTVIKWSGEELYTGGERFSENDLRELAYNCIFKDEEKSFKVEIHLGGCHCDWTTDDLKSMFERNFDGAYNIGINEFEVVSVKEIDKQGEEV